MNDLQQLKISLAQKEQELISLHTFIVATVSPELAWRIGQLVDDIASIKKQIRIIPTSATRTVYPKISPFVQC